MIRIYRRDATTCNFIVTFLLHIVALWLFFVRMKLTHIIRKFSNLTRSDLHAETYTRYHSH